MQVYLTSNATKQLKLELAILQSNSQSDYSHAPFSSSVQYYR